MHDSQAVIPLAQMTDERVTNLYDLMDAAYDSKEIHEMSERLNHVPIIDSNKRKGDKKVMAHLMFGIIAMTADQLFSTLQIAFLFFRYWLQIYLLQYFIPNVFFG